MKTKFKLVRRRDAYIAVGEDGEQFGYCVRERNFMAASGYAGWNFKPNAHGLARGLKPIWETTPRRAVEASLRGREAVS
jgi:hypothetical protein